MLGTADAVLLLALNVFQEARGESLAGKVAVAEVTLNRVASGCFPRQLKTVIYEPSQFSWTASNRISYRDAQRLDPISWEISKDVANLALTAHTLKLRKSIGSATYFHTMNVRPSWASKAKLVKSIGQHKFYALPC